MGTSEEGPLLLCLDPPNVALLRALWSVLDGVRGILKRSLGGAGGRDAIISEACQNVRDCRPSLGPLIICMSGCKYLL